MTNNVIISTDITQTLTETIERITHDKLFLLADQTTYEQCFPVVKHLPCLCHAQPIVIGATDAHKTLYTLAQVWKAMSDNGATRHSLLVNLGGGMVTD